MQCDCLSQTMFRGEMEGGGKLGCLWFKKGRAGRLGQVVRGSR